jgi:hypothetical protein
MTMPPSGCAVRPPLCSRAGSGRKRNLGTNRCSSPTICILQVAAIRYHIFGVILSDGAVFMPKTGRTNFIFIMSFFSIIYVFFFIFLFSQSVPSYLQTLFSQAGLFAWNFIHDYPSHSFKSILYLTPNELGDFLSGLFAPLVFFWVAASLFIQNREYVRTLGLLHTQTDNLAEQVSYMRQASSDTYFMELLREIQFEREKISNKIAYIADSDAGEFYLRLPAMTSSEGKPEYELLEDCKIFFLSMDEQLSDFCRELVQKNGKLSSKHEAKPKVSSLIPLFEKLNHTSTRCSERIKNYVEISRLVNISASLSIILTCEVKT